MLRTFSWSERCFEDELYQASKLLFTSISNWARLATTLIYLEENQAEPGSHREREEGWKYRVRTFHTEYG